MGGPAIKFNIKLIASFVAFLFLLNILNNGFITNASAQEENQGGFDAPTPLNPIKYILYLAGIGTTILAPIFQMFAAAVIADPTVVEIGYNETKIIQIGMMDFKTGNFSEAQNQVILDGHKDSRTNNTNDNTCYKELW